MMSSGNIVHPTAETLEAFGLGQLDSFSATPVRQHLESCPACRQHVEKASNSALRRAQYAPDYNSTPSPTRPLSQLSQILKGQAGAIPVASTLPPELLAHPQYDIIRLIGRGGMGVVYQAKNKLMDRMEVLKVINKTLMDRPGSLERFLREIRSASKLNHVNVVKAYSALQLGDLLVFAMEYVEGEDLAKYVQAHGPLPVVHACYYAKQVAAGLQHAHEKGMVHRDIKPQNLILTKDGKKHIVKILDFGLAKVSREKGMERELTGQGWMLGTPDYMAPEQIMDAATADIRADIYSLGCTLYFLLTGAPCFQAKSLLELLQAHQSLEPRPLHHVRPGVTVELNTVVGKMMAKDPAQRYQTPAEVVEALKEFLKQGTKETEPGSGPVLALAEGTVQTSRTPPAPSAPTAALPAAQPRVDERIAPATRVPGPEFQVLPVGSVTARPKQGSSSLMWLTAVGAVVVLVAVVAALGAGYYYWSANRTGVQTATGTDTGTSGKETSKDTMPIVTIVKDGTLVLEKLPASAEVLVDGKIVSGTEIAVAPGMHTVEVRKTGYTTFTTGVAVSAGGRASVPITLQPLATVIVLEQLPLDAVVLVDGQQVSFKAPGPGGAVDIPTTPGNRKVEVRKTGYKPFISNVALVAGARLPIQVSLEKMTVDNGKAVPPPMTYHYKAEDVAKYMNAAVVRVTNLADKANTLNNFGYDNGISILGGWVEEKKNLTVTLTLTGGVQYLFLAAGDNDAVDVDLEILDAGNNVVAKDTDTNPDAVVNFTPPANGKYTVKMTLYQSKNKVPCVCVTVVLKKDGSKVAVNNLDKAVGKIMKAMEAGDKALFDKSGKRIDLFQGAGQWAFYGGVLNQGSDMSMTNLTFGSGERYFLGVGDDSAQVIKLTLEDSSGKAIKTDSVSSSTSVLDYTATGGTNGLRIYNTQSTGPSVVLMAVFDAYTPPTK
jgi:serine/threonine protein kinase